MIASSVVRRACALALPVLLVACAGGDKTADSPAVATDTAGAMAPAPAPSGDVEDRVERALDADSTLGAFGIDADEEDGKIELKGRVSTQVLKDAATAVATREAGGMPIDNQMKVDAGFTASGTRPVDADDAEDNVEDAIDADPTLKDLDIGVDEENGALVLEGSVKTAAQATAALDLAKRIAGMIAVTSKLTVKP